VRYHHAAIYFNRESIFDGYSGNPLFKGQVRNFNDASSTGATLRRRALSVAPGTTLPPRGCLKIGNLRWLVGLGVADTFQGREARETYNLKVGSSLFEILSPAQACSPATAVAPAYGYESFFKATQDANTSSSYDTFWNVFFVPIEPVSAGTFLRSGARLLRVRQTYVNAEQLRVAESDELDPDWSKTAVFTNLGAYDPVTDTYASTSVSVRVVQMDIFKFYRWRVEAESGRKPGDKTVLAPLPNLPSAGTVFTMNGESWRVISAQPELDVFAIHARPT
jgi:hypothetical protein